MPIIDYLFYKFYKGLLKSSVNDIAVWATTIFLGGIIGINILEVNLILAKLDIIYFPFNSKSKTIIFLSCILLLSCFLFLWQKRFLTIIEKYSNETNRKRIIGNIVVWSYVIMSFLMMFVIAFFRPGK